MLITLTKRETQVAEQITLGKSNLEISAVLGISYETVKEHVKNIYHKTGFNRVQLAVWMTKQTRCIDAKTFRPVL